MKKNKKLKNTSKIQNILSNKLTTIFWTIFNFMKIKRWELHTMSSCISLFLMYCNLSFRLISMKTTLNSTTFGKEKLDQIFLSNSYKCFIFSTKSKQDSTYSNQNLACKITMDLISMTMILSIPIILSNLQCTEAIS